MLCVPPNPNATPLLFFPMRKNNITKQSPKPISQTTPHQLPIPAQQIPLNP